MELHKMRRYGFGERTEQNEASGTWRYENGVVEFSEKAAKHATQQYPRESPAGAVALCLAELGGVNLADYVDDQPVDIDADALSDAVQSIDGVGESTAQEVVNAVQGLLDGEADA